MSINVNISHREDFPLLRDSNIVYLDNAATSQKPDCVLLRAGDAGLRAVRLEP